MNYQLQRTAEEGQKTAARVGNPKLIKENKEDAHVIAIPHDSRQTALRHDETR
ncbi:MAG TPA: hypothetical protein VF531_06100 [Bacillota bacterium]